jgi:hypothetical protein
MAPREAQALLRRLNARLRVPWAELLRLLQAFQLEGHLAFLARFRTLFQQHDPERRGLVSTAAFAEMAAAVLADSAAAAGLGASAPAQAQAQAQAARLAAQADRERVGLVTFSKAVEVLSKAATQAPPASPPPQRAIAAQAPAAVDAAGAAASGAAAASQREAAVDRIGGSRAAPRTERPQVGAGAGASVGAGAS